ncbi:DNA-binding response regulator [Aurantiacibacter xanthus]|uniref:DNA-binding response regulator n=2 Tax=Aurantiacibacter xanthus TaxID=1784712 RepID=A0A3A1P944_9SPHN|nr:DNA-binding response regulator [Aurantiacibacter xanthus]
MRILLVEDDEEVAHTLVAFLMREGFVVDHADCLAVAREAVRDEEFDVVLLDRMLPDGDGVELMAFARKIRRPQRFLLLTALDGVDERVAGLDGGANDYIVKPFEPRELVARIRNAMRFTPQIEPQVRRFGPLAFDVETTTFTIDGEPFVVRRSEALVLAALMARPGSLVQRETLESRVYGYDRMVSSNSLESQISRLRKALADRTDGLRIQVERGVGYRLCEP